MEEGTIAFWIPADVFDVSSIRNSIIDKRQSFNVLVFVMIKLAIRDAGNDNIIERYVYNALLVKDKGFLRSIGASFKAASRLEASISIKLSNRRSHDRTDQPFSDILKNAVGKPTFGLL